MNLLSKTSPVEDSILAMRRVLDSLECEVSFSEEKHPLQNCYSVNLASREAPNHIYSNGKGSSSLASRASAYGEYIERLQTNNFFTDFYLPNRAYYPDQEAFSFGGAYLDKKLKKFYSCDGELKGEDLVEFNSQIEDKIISLPFKNLKNEIVYFPINILSNLYVSNGLASGNTKTEAKVQAISEIYERYAKNEIIKNGYSLPSFPSEVLQRFDKLNIDMQLLRQNGYIVDILDASLGGVFPVVAISLINQKNSTLFVSFGAHPILEVAIERTMTELMQGRGLDNLDAFETPTFDMVSVDSSSNLESHFIDSNGKMGFGFLSSKKSFSYTSWGYSGSGCDDEWEYLCLVAKGLKKEIYIREYDYVGFNSCQILIPSLSEVYPLDDLIYNNKNSGKLIRQMVLNFCEYDPEIILDEIFSLEDSIKVGAYIGVIFENDFTIGELKGQLNLMLANMDEASQYFGFSQSKLALVICELILMQSEGLDFKDYQYGLYCIYGEELVCKANKIIKNEEYFIDLKFHEHYNNMLNLYDRLGIQKYKCKF